MAKVRLWLWRLLVLVVCVGIYSFLDEPLDTWFAILAGLAFAAWLYNRVSGRMKWTPLRMKIEQVETITPTHILLVLILLVMLACHSELVHLEKATNNVRDSLTDVQNSATDNADEIKSSLDDVKSAVEANQ